MVFGQCKIAARETTRIEAYLQHLKTIWIVENAAARGIWVNNHKDACRRVGVGAPLGPRLRRPENTPLLNFCRPDALPNFLGLLP